MTERERIGVGLLFITLAALPVLFFLIVVESPLLALAALAVEAGLFAASRIALGRPQQPVGAARFQPPRQR
jgi:hypothetical protein